MNFLYLYKYFSETLGQSALGVMQLDNGVKNEFPEDRLAADDGVDLWLRIRNDGKSSRFFWSKDGADFAPIGPSFETSKLSDEYSQFGEFTGTFVGIACGDRLMHKHTADFDLFSYEVLE